MAEEYGEFKEVDEEGKEIVVTEGEEGVRVRFPRKSEFIGVILQRFGGARMEVLTTDGKHRNCRVPGKYKRKLWLRPKDIVLIAPWVDDDSKGDVIFKYTSSSISQLRRRGMLEGLQETF